MSSPSGGPPTELRRWRGKIAGVLARLPADPTEAECRTAVAWIDYFLGRGPAPEDASDVRD